MEQQGNMQSQNTQFPNMQNVDWGNLQNAILPSISNLLRGPMSPAQQTNINVNSFLENINDEFRPKRKMDFTPIRDLPQNTKLTIKQLKPYSTKFGERLLIELSLTQVGKEMTFSVFLPDRYKKMSSEYIEFLTTNPNIYFVYGGKDKDGHHQINWTQ